MSRPNSVPSQQRLEITGKTCQVVSIATIGAKPEDPVQLDEPNMIIPT